MHLVGIGLQLFTVRDQLKEDFKGTVASVAQMGYEGLEVGGEITAPQKARDLFDSLGLQVFAAHVGLEKMEEDIGWTADFVHTMGARYAVIIGEDEVKAGTVTLRHMADARQETIASGDLPGRLKVTE